MANPVYTSTPLVKKLGILEDMKIYAINAPENYFEILGNVPKGVEVFKKVERQVECVHAFITDSSKISSVLEDAAAHIFSLGMVWVSWPRTTTDSNLNERNIKIAARNFGLSDEKFTLVNDYWYGLLLKPNRRAL